MTELILERQLDAQLETVFAFVTRRENLLTWWGPEGMFVPVDNLDFTRTGPWHSTMENSNGEKFKVSGEVTRVEPPHLVAFTWGWHDEKDMRGHESEVVIRLEETGPQSTRLTLEHRGLADEESAKHHQMGWESSLRKLVSAF